MKKTTLTLKQASFYLQDWYCKNTKSRLTDCAAYCKIWRAANNGFLTVRLIGHKRLIVFDDKTERFLGITAPRQPIHPNHQGKHTTLDRSPFLE